MAYKKLVCELAKCTPLPFAKIREVARHLVDAGVTFATENNGGHKWIPVTERLPEHIEVVLCRLRFNEFRILQWDEISKWWLGYGAGDDWRQKDVTHWMPLPEPPKEGE